MAKRTDSNQAEIVKALRGVGASVWSLHKEGKGCPDLAIGFRGCNYFIEVKLDKGKLRPMQVEWHASWRGQVATVNCVAQALAVIGATFAFGTPDCQC